MFPTNITFVQIVFRSLQLESITIRRFRPTCMCSCTEGCAQFNKSSEEDISAEFSILILILNPLE